MKKLILCHLAIATILISACSNDDNNVTTPPETMTPTNETLIVGKWNRVAIQIGGNVLDPGDCELNGFLQLNADKTYIEQGESGLIGLPCSPDPANDGTWKLVDNILTTNDPENTIVSTVDHEILELSETTLKYKFTIEVPEIVTEIWTFERDNGSN